MRRLTMYLHTMDGLPASFLQGEGRIMFGNKHRLARSLRQIRREQRISRESDEANGCLGHFRYSYTLVEVPQCDD